MNDPIISVDTIQAEARAAAAIYSDINAACPYPFGTAAANHFKQAFNQARQALQQATQPEPTV